ncbi:hypothetical protein SAMN04488132_101148 [Sediminibacterium ginsengisoli]|uniref:Uncharacterized protein n=1 Tax=Sediminibacterium ginsengisoli TaxID=413434 RepID=A0A1T4JSM4_9BACT|nr:hypothetical protein SAMN04488132_101148 [Sediminibacterium ginsengisoli]
MSKYLPALQNKCGTGLPFVLKRTLTVRFKTRKNSFYNFIKKTVVILTGIGFELSINLH